MLGASALGLHVEGDTVSKEDLQREQGAAALVNSNNRHWNVLRCEKRMHINNVVGHASHKGRKTGVIAEAVPALLRRIRNESGGVSLHRSTAAE